MCAQADQGFLRRAIIASAALATRSQQQEQQLCSSDEGEKPADAEDVPRMRPADAEEVPIGHGSKGER